MNNVTQIVGEQDRYYVSSQKTSRDSQEVYLVDLSTADFGCTCGHWDYRLRPTWENMRKLKVKPSAELGCKHIKEAFEFRNSLDQTN